MLLYIISNCILNFVGGYISSYRIDTKSERLRLAPPNIVFPIVWTILYILLGFLIGNIIEDEWLACIYYIQLSLNFLWTIVFFGMRQRVLSAIIIISIIVLTSVILAYRTDLLYLIVPYLAWLCFALVLNIESIIRSRGLL